MKRKGMIALLTLLCSLTAGAQTMDCCRPDSVTMQQQVPFSELSAHDKWFNHLDLGVTLGTTGVGLDVQMPVNDILRLRAGVEVMPHFHYDMHFELGQFDKNGTQLESRFDRISALSEALTGYTINQDFVMEAEPSFWNMKLLVDIYPFRNKHWHVTAGFHWGPSEIASAVNSLYDAPTLFGISMYNNIYNKFAVYEPMYYEMPDGSMFRYFPEDFYNINLLGPLSESANINLSPDILERLYDRLMTNGSIGAYVGRYTQDITDSEGNVVHHKGDSYIMEPDERCTVHAHMRVNRFKPYLGVGYEGRLARHDDSFRVAVDAGLMFWGGKPDVYLHDGTNLITQVSDFVPWGNVKPYVHFVKQFPAFPVVNVRITKRIF